jgi:cell division protein FtsI/penicillin-binding protein 2
MAGAPTYDPKVWVGGITSKQLAKLYSKDGGNPLLSRPTQGQFAPGSTWKPVMTAGALSNGYSQDTRLNCSSAFQVGNRAFKNYESGAHLQLTLDAAIQDRTEAVLAQVGAKYRPKSATAVVLDPRTNEVLAMANWPRVDPNHPAEAPAEARQNRAVGFTYEPGSTFKAFTVAGALQDGKVSPDTVFDLPPTIQVADRTIGESHVRGPEALTTSQILAQSSNVGAIKIGLLLKKRRFDHWVREFGFGKPTGVDLPGEERGIILPVSKYSGSSMGNLPIGQGESVTSMQLATAYSAIANGGVLRRPQVIRKVDGKVVRGPAASASSPSRSPRRSARCSAASSPRAAPRPRSTSPATSWRARPARPTRSTRRRASTPRRTTSRRSSASPPRRTPSSSSP